STRVLFILATEGMIVRARPRGTWVSSQYRWTSMDSWVPASGPEPTTDEARVGLVRLYLRRFGPATETDVVWWTGWTKTATRRALAAVGAVEVDLDGGVGLALPDDLEPVDDAGSWVALLPSLDSTIMGWKQRDWYLGPHGPALFDTNGNAGPTVWVDGRVVGGWAQSADGTVIYELIEGVGSGVRDAVAVRASELSEWLEGKVLMPRFPSPLHQRLTVP
ncbi:MAG: winged helix DNA-binding domain-containing protein, partial [Acidimicrobiia bacterium]